jgi:hypothetical protein
MKENLKNKLFEAINSKLDEDYPDMQESSRRKIANVIQGICIQILNENNEGLSSSYAEMAVEMESHKKMFRDHIEAIQKHYKVVMDSFKKNGVVKMEIDRKTNRPMLVGRTTVVTEMVIFLNYLNNLTMDFYENVYKFNDDKDMRATQTTLF